jgi:hypothetical protein
MKKVYLLFFFFIPVFLVQSQTLLYEDFENTNFPPSEWNLINGNAPTGYSWARNTDSSLGYMQFKKQAYPAFQGAGSMVYEFDENGAKAWAITPVLSLKKDVSYTISFYYTVFNSEYPEKLKVSVGNAPTIDAQSTILWDNDGSTQLTNDNAWTKATIRYSPATTGDFYFGFNCYSDPKMFALIVDNIKVEITPTAAPPCAVLTGPADGATNISAPQALFTWDSASTASQYIFRLGTTDTPDSIAFSTALQNYQSNLRYSTTYYWTAVPKNDAGYAAGCPVYSFTTQAAPPVPPNDECSTAIALTEGSTVHASTKSATQSMVADLCNAHKGNANDDVWFKLTPTQSGDVAVTLTPDLIFDGVINAYSGACGSLSAIACADAGVDGEPETLTLQNVNAGESYYLRIYGFDGIGKDGSFTLSVSGKLLPVNIAGFKGAQNRNQNVLTWTTLSEQNNKGFELQRSTNGKDFNKLAFIGSKAFDGNSSSVLTYQIADEKPLVSSNYYRLKQIDKDGKSIISDIVSLKGSGSNSLSFSAVYPNPAKSFVNVIISTPDNTIATITVTDFAGKAVMQRAPSLTIGDNNLSLDVNKLPNGTYFIKAVNASGSQTIVNKLVKQ